MGCILDKIPSTYITVSKCRCLVSKVIVLLLCLTRTLCPAAVQVHVILNLLNPVSQDVVEHHLMSAPGPKADKLSHVYTLVLYSNHRCEKQGPAVKGRLMQLQSKPWGECWPG